MAREGPGWTFHQLGKWFICSHRDDEEYRGSAVGFRSDLWTLMRKKRSPKQIWVRLRRVSDGVEVWCGSTYLSQGSTREKHASEVHSFLDTLPCTTLPVLLGGDMNTPVKWSQGEGDEAVASSSETKGEYLIGMLTSKGIRLTAPRRHQWSTPTSRPRRADAQGRQIDMMGVKHAFAEHAVIHTDSHMFLGTCDHDAVSQVVVFRCRPQTRGKRGGNRPRVVVKKPVVKEDLTQDVLERLARECTRPVPGVAYRDPLEVRRMFRHARDSRVAKDWKAALRARMEARKMWMGSKIEAATAGDWSAFKLATKKGAQGSPGQCSGRRKGSSPGNSLSP